MSNKEQELRDEIVAHLERYPHVKKQMTGGLLVRLLNAQQSSIKRLLFDHNDAMQELFIDKAKTILETIKSNYDSATDTCTSGAEEIADVLEILTALRSNKEK